MNLISAIQGSDLGKLGLQIMKERNSLPDYDISGLAVNFRKVGRKIEINVSTKKSMITSKDSLYNKIDEMLRMQ